MIWLSFFLEWSKIMKKRWPTLKVFQPFSTGKVSSDNLQSTQMYNAFFPCERKLTEGEGGGGDTAKGGKGRARRGTKCLQVGPA